MLFIRILSSDEIDIVVRLEREIAPGIDVAARNGDVAVGSISLGTDAHVAA